MATKKKTEVTEADVQQVEAVEEKPKKTTTKKTTTKKKTEPAVEVPAVVEETKAEPAPAKVEEKKPEPKKVEKKEEKKDGGPFTVVITAGNGVYSFKGPGLAFPRCRTIANGTKVTISEVKGSWGKTGDGSWILLGTTSVRI